MQNIKSDQRVDLYIAIPVYVCEDGTIIICVGGVEKDAEARKPITLPPEVKNCLKWGRLGIR